MKVLIITYYWSPSGGSGVQRWLKFAKYLPDFNITPIIYAPKDANYPTIDEKIETPDVEVIKRPIFNPQDILLKKKEESGVANLNKGGLLSWIRGNFFIPDAKVFWVNPSVKFITKYIKENNIDVIVSSGPPHSMHLIAEKVKRKTNVKWIADFRDPWTTLYYADDFNLSNFAKQKNQQLEQKVLQNADVTITVSKTIQQELSEKSDAVKVIPNGYDDEVLISEGKLDQKFSISHIGLLPRQSNPKLLWEVLSEITKENSRFKKDLQITLTGNVSVETTDEITKNGLQNNLKLNGYVSHKKAVQLQKQAQVLLLLIPKTKNSKGILTGKVFEYITTRRPILAIGDEDGDLAEILSETKTGMVVDFEDKSKLKSVILNFYNQYLQGKLIMYPEHIEQYHRKKLTQVLSQIITTI